MDASTLQDRLRGMLLAEARKRQLLTYKAIADELGLEPPQTIHRVTRLLEALMAEDAAAGRPLLAAVCVSRRRPVPARGFFITAAELGLFRGNPEGPEADAFHAAELERVFSFHAPG